MLSHCGPDTWATVARGSRSMLRTFWLWSLVMMRMTPSTKVKPTATTWMPPPGPMVDSVARW